MALPHAVIFPLLRGSSNSVKPACRWGAPTWYRHQAEDRRARGEGVLSEEPMSRGPITTLYPENLLPVSVLNVLMLTFRKMLSPFRMDSFTHCFLHSFMRFSKYIAIARSLRYKIKLSFIHLLSYHSFIHSFIKSKIMYRGSHIAVGDLEKLLPVEHALKYWVK